MEKWMVMAKKADFNQIARDYGITPVMARILRNRDLISDEEIRMFLHGTLSDLPSPFARLHMKEATQLLVQKIKEQAPIRVIGDYDVDGICSTYILTRGLTSLSAQVSRRIPHRMKDGYGLNQRLIEEAHADGVDTILTCDNGIAAAEEIALAKHYGMTVIVTDHHEVPFTEEGGEKIYQLPPADVIVDPKLPEDQSFSGICGALLAYYLIDALYQIAQEKAQSFMDCEKERRECILAELLPFAALATVCDVMELRAENRIVVKAGLQAMKETGNKGLMALLQATDLKGKELTPYHAGFLLGPCLNATGRLDSADRALRLFEETDASEALILAADLKSLNDSRKKMTEDGAAEAIRMIEGTALKEDRILVIYLPDCHESIAGIIAGRIKEKYNRPTIVMTKAEDGVKGSGRSIESYDMFQELSACKDLFTRFGGHQMAAGLSMDSEEKIDMLRKRLNQACTLTEEDFVRVVHIDVPMPMAYANRDFVRELSLLEPFGTGNQKPVFAEKEISLLSGRLLGKNRNVGKYRISDKNGGTYDMIFFGDIDAFHAFLTEKFGTEKLQALYERRLVQGEVSISVVYYPDINSYMGRESIQIVMQSYDA